MVAQVNTKVRGIIEAGGGTLLKVDNWGKRKLAYEVKKQLKGIYLFFSYLGTAGLVEEVERNLRLLDSVIRYYSVKIAENVDPASRTSERHRRVVRQGGRARARRGGDRDRPGDRRARCSVTTRKARSTSKRPCSAASTSRSAEGKE